MGGLAVVIAATAALTFLLTQFGELKAYHNGAIMTQGRTKQPYTWGMVLLENRTNHPITIDSVHVQTGNLKVVQLDLTHPNHWYSSGGMLDRWPPLGYRPGPEDLVKPHGLVLPKQGKTLIFGELVMPRPGRYPIGPTVTVQYRAGLRSYQVKLDMGKADMLCTKGSCPAPGTWHY